tara:strand:+ start:938 stop:1510 length:573 start_codon:yes stop_codon:yes gene_type:complete
MEEVEKEIKKYQYKKGDSFGKIVEVERTDDNMTYFTDGTQIFNEVVAEFLDEMEGDDAPLPGGMETYTDSLKKDAVILNKEDSNISTKQTKVEEKVPELTNNKHDTDSFSVIDSLITKLSKKNFEAVDAKLNINLPTRGVFKMILENGDESKEELLESVINNAVKQIEINKLQEFLTIEASNFIKKYYGR